MHTSTPAHTHFQTHTHTCHNVSASQRWVRLKCTPGLQTMYIKTSHPEAIAKHSHIKTQFCKYMHPFFVRIIKRIMTSFFVFHSNCCFPQQLTVQNVVTWPWQKVDHSLKWMVLSPVNLVGHIMAKCLPHMYGHNSCLSQASSVNQLNQSMTNYSLRITEYYVRVCVCVVCVKSSLSKYVHIINMQVLRACEVRHSKYSLLLFCRVSKLGVLHPVNQCGYIRVIYFVDTLNLIVSFFTRTGPETVQKPDKRKRSSKCSATGQRQFSHTTAICDLHACNNKTWLKLDQRRTNGRVELQPQLFTTVVFKLRARAMRLKWTAKAQQAYCQAKFDTDHDQIYWVHPKRSWMIINWHSPRRWPQPA